MMFPSSILSADLGNNDSSVECCAHKEVTCCLGNLLFLNNTTSYMSVKGSDLQVNDLTCGLNNQTAKSLTTSIFFPGLTVTT